LPRPLLNPRGYFVMLLNAGNKEGRRGRSKHEEGGETPPLVRPRAHEVREVKVLFRPIALRA
jgi:hypothetical protein